MLYALLALAAYNLLSFYLRAESHYFTHRARFYGVPCYWNEETRALAGQTLLADAAVFFLPYLHNALAFVIQKTINPAFENPGFPILIGPALGDEWDEADVLDEH